MYKIKRQSFLCRFIPSKRNFQFIALFDLALHPILGPLSEGAVSEADWGSVLLLQRHSRPHGLRRATLAAARPVAALTAHRAVIHYRDCASLTLREGGKE